TDSMNAVDQFRTFYGWFIDDIRIYTCAPLTVSFATASRTVTEAAGTVAVQATLNGPADEAVTVPFTVGGSATPGADYSLPAGTIVIQAGSLTGAASLHIVDDAQQEADETVVVTLGSPSGATLGSTPVQTITIADNDVPGRKIFLPLVKR